MSDITQRQFNDLRIEVERLRADNAAMLAALKVMVEHFDWRNKSAAELNANVRAAIARAEGQT